MKRIYKLDGWKAYEGETFLGMFQTKELAERAKELAEKILPRYDYDGFEIKEIILHEAIPAWRKWLVRRFTLSKKRIRQITRH